MSHIVKLDAVFKIISIGHICTYETDFYYLRSWNYTFYATTNCQKVDLFKICAAKSEEKEWQKKNDIKLQNDGIKF